MKKKKLLTMILCITMILSASAPAFTRESAYDESDAISVQEEKITDEKLDDTSEQEKSDKPLDGKEKTAKEGYIQRNDVKKIDNSKGSSVKNTKDTVMLDEITGLEFELVSGEAFITGAGSYSDTENLVIPKTVKSGGKTYSVVSIGDYAFKKSDYKSVFIPKSIRSIGRAVFDQCEKIKKVIFEEGSVLKDIGVLAFSDNNSLKAIRIPDSVNRLREEALFYCDNMAAIVMPNNDVYAEVNSLYCQQGGLIIYVSSKEQIDSCINNYAHNMDKAIFAVRGNKEIDISSAQFYKLDENINWYTLGNNGEIIPFNKGDNAEDGKVYYSYITVNFDSNGGSKVEDQKDLLPSDLVSEPNAPTREGYKFDGWYYDNNTFKNKVRFPFETSKDLTIYAKWIKIKTSDKEHKPVVDNNAKDEPKDDSKSKDTLRPKNPDTSDDMNTFLYVFIGLVSLIGAGVSIYKMKKAD